MQYRDAFIKTSDAGTWAKMAESLAFERASETAILELMAECSTSNDPQAAAANQFRLQGARQVIHVLGALTKITKAPEKIAIGQLNHDLK